MPRLTPKDDCNSTNNFYTSQYTHSTPTSTPSPQPSNPSSLSRMSSRQSNHKNSTVKKKHICPTCDRAFTTSGHLARHGRIHTGERNHKCPFPGCETRCSRQDNLQQHYRIHLSPGSRRSSSSATRQAIARAMSNDGATSGSSGKRSSVPGTSSIPGLVVPPPPTEPPALEQARPLTAASPPPDSPPPLAPATLPATVHHRPNSGSTSSSSSPELSYSDTLHHGHAPLVSSPTDSAAVVNNGSSHSPPQYRSGTSTYQEQSQGGNFTYVHSSPMLHSSVHHVELQPHGMQNDPYPFSDTFENHPNAQSSLSRVDDAHQHSPPAVSSAHLPTSRHSIAHISPPQQFPHSHPHSRTSGLPPTGGDNVGSRVSQSSGPMGSGYAVYRDEAQEGPNFHSNNSTLNGSTNHVGISAYHSSHSELVHGSYAPSLSAQQSALASTRYESPPPVLAPIQDIRVGRFSQRSPQLHHNSYSPPIHHHQPSSNYNYYSSDMSMGHTGWKSDYGLRGRDAIVQ